jgi:hypothetical protein
MHEFRYKQVRPHELFDIDWQACRALVQEPDRPLIDTDWSVLVKKFRLFVYAPLQYFALYTAWRPGPEQWPVPGTEIQVLHLPSKFEAGVRLCETGDVRWYDVPGEIPDFLKQFYTSEESIRRIP